jgi:hypothetical protein
MDWFKLFEGIVAGDSIVFGAAVVASSAAVLQLVGRFSQDREAQERRALPSRNLCRRIARTAIFLSRSDRLDCEPHFPSSWSGGKAKIFFFFLQTLVEIQLQIFFFALVISLSIRDNIWGLFYFVFIGIAMFQSKNRMGSTGKLIALFFFIFFPSFFLLKMGQNKTKRKKKDCLRW